MSRYPVKYVSGSKKAELNIEDMATPHLMNAWRKVVDRFNDVQTSSVALSDLAELGGCMKRELVSRGCTLDPHTGRWEMPPKEEITRDSA